MTNLTAVPSTGPITKNKRVVYITSEVANGALEAELMKALQPAQFRFCPISSDSAGKIDGIAKSIEMGTFDFVLFCEAFTSHSKYHKIKESALASPRPTEFVHVGKGRVGEVMRAIEKLSEQPPRHNTSGRPRGAGSLPRWTGAELVLLEDMARKGHSDEAIQRAISSQCGFDRSLAAIAAARVDFFGLKIRPRGGYDPDHLYRARNLPREYYDIRQAQRINEKVSAEIRETAPPPPAPPLPPPPPPAPPAPQPIIEEVPAPVSAPVAKKKGDLMVTIHASKGDILIASRYPLHQLIALITGEE